MNGNQEHLQVFLAKKSTAYIVEFFSLHSSDQKKNTFLNNSEEMRCDKCT